jgi:membrane protease YdiL (CAAX protease family)
MDTTASTKKRYGIIGLLFAIGFPFLLLLTEPLFPGYLRYGYLKKLIIWIWLMALFLIVTKIEKKEFLIWKDGSRSLWFYIISVICLFALVMLASAFQLLLPKLGFKIIPSPFLREMILYLQTHPFLLVLTCITAGVVEELIFRGYLIPRFCILFRNKYPAVIVSALLFGLVHAGYGTFLNMFVPFLLGLIFGVYYLKYKNLTPLIICHFLIDLLSLISFK